MSENVTGSPSMYLNHAFDLERQFLIINTTEPMVPGKFYVLDVPSFRGALTGDLAGLYLSSYKRGDITTYL